MIPQKPSQFAICSWSTHPKDPADLAGRLKELGLDKVQLHLTPVYADPRNWGNVQADLRAHGIEIISGMFGTKGEDYTSLDTIRQTGGFVPDQHWDENWKTVQQTAKVASDMKLKFVTCHAGFIPDDTKSEGFARLVDRLAKAAGEFGRYGIALGFETGQETADTLNKFLDALEAKGAKNIGVNFDPANMILYAKGDPIASLKKLMPRVKQVHIKDAVKTQTPGTWGTEVAIGEGQVDWKAFLQTLAEGNFRGSLVIEREAGQDRVGDVRKAIERLSRLM
jgi:L-ribulose-5-phosphate 3-epimerase